MVAERDVADHLLPGGRERVSDLASALLLIGQLEQALLTNRIIALAVGMLMERHTIDSGAAWDRLRDHSNRSNIPVIQLAQAMIQNVER